MKILLCSVPFSPSVGGIESVSELLAQQFGRLGHEVTVVTQSAAAPGADEVPGIVRRPGARQLLRAVQQHDVVLHNQISLRLGWPLLLARKPWVVAHHTWLPREGAGRMKRLALRAAQHVAVSRSVAADLPVPCKVVPNPFDPEVFRADPTVQRQRDLVFFGRLVSDKGVPVLLQALLHLRQQGLRPSTSIIGGGPDEAALKAQVREAGLAPQVMFAGSLRGRALARALQAHRAVVVPSVWEEPFGLVALEGLACGCWPIVAASGGLPEAAGPAGQTFAKGDSQALAAAIAAWMRTPPPPAWHQEAAVQRHLQRHHPTAVAKAYLEVLDHACGEQRPLARAA